MPDHSSNVTRGNEFKRKTGRKPIDRGDPTSVVRDSEVRKAKSKGIARKNTTRESEFKRKKKSNTVREGEYNKFKGIFK